MFWVEIVFVKSGNIRNGTRRRHVANRNLSQLNSFARQRVCPHKYFVFVFSLVLSTDVCQNHIHFFCPFYQKPVQIRFDGVKNCSCIQVHASVLILASKHLKGQLDPPVCDVTFFGSKEVSWIPLSVTWRFWIIEGQLDPPVGDVAFLDQRRSVRSPCRWRDVFGS